MFAAGNRIPFRAVVADEMAQQVGLFGAQPTIFVDDASGTIAYYPELFTASESAELFRTFEARMPWSQESMWMYDRTVSVPRLVARCDMHALSEELAALRGRVETFLSVPFNAISLQYYRDGSDSVAWHSDHTEELIDQGIVALVSLGAVREMQIRSKSKPRRAFAVDLEPGSLLVMGGRAQDFWEHHVPKVKRPTRPRISVALRQRRSA